MKNRIGLAAAFLLACASLLRGQQNMFKLEGPTGNTMVSLNEPNWSKGNASSTRGPTAGSRRCPRPGSRKSPA